MRKLDPRLTCVADMIGDLDPIDRIHADIGSDHAHLLWVLLTTGTICKGIAIENKRSPFENSRATLHDVAAEVRLADGFAGLRVGEVDSASLCGMGGELIVKLLRRFPDRVPKHVFVQANSKLAEVRRWAIDGGYHLIDEREVVGARTFVVMAFRAAQGKADPVYQQALIRSLDPDAAFLFGPHLLLRWQPDFERRMIAQRDYWQQFSNAGASASERLRLLQSVLDARRSD